MSLSSLPISLQLWSVREATARDFAGTVRAVAAMGYDGVETAGYGNLDVAGAAAAIREAGLKVTGMHVGQKRLVEDLDAVIGEARLLGCTDVICPSWPKDAFATAEGCSAAAAALGAIGARVRQAGIRFSFHNHAVELAIVGGVTVFERLLDANAPLHLQAEVDVYWVVRGGQDPAAFLRRLGSRAPLVHLKDEKEFGDGPVDFPAVIETLRSTGCAEVLVVEQEQYTLPPLDAVAKDLKLLRGWL